MGVYWVPERMMGYCNGANPSSFLEINQSCWVQHFPLMDRDPGGGQRCVGEDRQAEEWRRNRRISQGLHGIQ